MQIYKKNISTYEKKYLVSLLIFFHLLVKLTLKISSLMVLKMEAYANKYSFVWRKAIEKSKEKLQEKIKNHFLLYGISVNDDYLYYLSIFKKYLKEKISNKAIKFIIQQQKEITGSTRI